MRATLLNAWIYAFGTGIPKAVGKGDELDGGGDLNCLKEVLNPQRFSVENPYELVQQMETVIYIALLQLTVNILPHSENSTGHEIWSGPPGRQAGAQQSGRILSRIAVPESGAQGQSPP